MANIVDLLIGLGIDASEYDAGLSAADQHSTSFIDRMAGPLTTAVVGAFAVGGAAVAGFASDSVNHFADFQASMNEVFTLLPGISQDAMGDMSHQVEQFSKDFGVLPEKVVPALYQSLSAGVPPDNVFKFLESANKAATAGVTDLSVAVDGISSVVNAYGSDVIDATKASDLMFTAVKLGKTNFEQLSSSLFNVTPAASAAGVEFKTVTAALAAMTLQGVPTNVATTKLRAAINELSQAGTKTDKIFREVAGKSFKEFIASGGDMQGALQLLERHARDTNVGINDLFGSVDAGSAALLLTGKGTDAFSNALKGMDESAGATDAAYATMNQGITDALDDMRASFAVFQLQVGERLAPVVQFFADQLGTLLPIAMQTATDFMDHVSGAINGLILAFNTSGGSFASLFTVIAEGSSPFSTFLQALGVGNSAAVAISKAIGSVISVLTPLLPLVNQVTALIGGNLQPILLAVGTVLAVVIVGAIASFVATLVATVAPILAVIAIIAALYAAFNNNFLGIRDIVNTVITFVTSLITTALTYIEEFWRANGDSIMATAHDVFDTVYTIIKFNIEATLAVVTFVFNAIAGFIQANGATIQTIISSNWAVIKNIFGAAFTLISGIFHAFTLGLRGDWAGAWLTIKNTVSTFLSQIWAAIQAGFQLVNATVTLLWNAMYDIIAGTLDRVTNWVAQTFQAVLNNIRGLGTAAASAAAAVGEGIVNGITHAIEAGVSSIINAARGAAMAALNAAKEALHIGSPSKAFEKGVGEPIIAGIVLGINNTSGQLVSTIQNALAPIAPNVSSLISLPINNILKDTERTASANAHSLSRSIIDRMEANFRGLANIAQSNIVDTLGRALNRADTSAATQADDIGHSIVNGITGSIGSGLSAIRSAARDAAQTALSAARHELGIASPSKLAAQQIGMPFVQGIVVGVNRMLGAVANAGSDAGTALANGATATAPTFNGNPTVGGTVNTGATASGVTQQFTIDAHYTKYEDERTLRDTIRMESALAL
jgi:TP901 family phage tail tape measure protein